MSQLTDAIKARNTEKALDLIRGTSFASRAYKSAFDRLYGNLLKEPELTERRKHARRVPGFGPTYEYYFARRPGYDPLQLAAKEGLTEVVRALLGAGVAVERTPPDNYSTFDYFAIKHHSTPPLNLALEFGHDETAMVLIEAGANVNAYSYTNLTYFGVPFDERPFYVDRGLLDAATPLYFAVTGRCNLTTMRALVERGAVASDALKCTSQAFKGIEDGFYPWVQGHHRGSILLNAVAHFDDTRIDVIEFLLAHGAEVDKYVEYSYDRDNQRYIHAMDQGFDLAAHKETYGNGVYDSALTLALRGGKEAIARLLLQNGARIFPSNSASWQESYDRDPRSWEDRLPSNIIAMAHQIAHEIYPHDIIERAQRFAIERAQGQFAREFRQFNEQHLVVWLDDIWIFIRHQQIMEQQFANELQQNEDRVENPIIPAADPVPLTWFNQIINFLGFRNHMLPDAEPHHQPPVQEQHVAVQAPAPIVRAFRRLPQTNIDTRPVIQQELDKLVQLDPTMSNHNFDETLLCPINKTLMIEPEMVLESDNTYEKSAIKRWFETHNTDPLSGRQLFSTATSSNGAVKRIILAELLRLYNAAEARKNVSQTSIARVNC